jgi:uncharacterized protein YndB with AHSA1/START domain
MNTATMTGEREIVVDAPAASVFAALTEPEQLLQWWGDDAAYRVTHMDHDLRLRGSVRFSGRFADGREFSATGIYRVIDPPRVLEHTRLYARGVPIEEETVIRYELEERDGRTRVRVVHSGFQSEQARSVHEDGWVRVLGWLSDYFRKASNAKMDAASDHSNTLIGGAMT